MRKELPLDNPIIETYQGESFILAVMLAYSNTKNIIYNNYINITTNVNERGILQLRFLNSLWENYRLYGFSEMSLYKRKAIEKVHFLEMIKELINQDNYLLFFSVDEFYLSYSDYYKRKHFTHDLYVYGYENNKFFILAYTKNHLSRIILDETELIDSFYGCRKKEEGNFCTFRVNREINIEKNIDIILNELNNYLKGEGHDDYYEGEVFGIKTYDPIYTYLKGFVANKTSYFDIRLFRELWEHKKLMTYRVCMLVEYIKCEDILEISNKVQVLAKDIFCLAMKYSIINDEKIIKSMLDKLSSLRNLDSYMISMLIDRLKNTIVESDEAF